MYQKGDLAFLIRKELVGGPWNNQGTLAMDSLHLPVEVIDVTYLGDEYQELAFVVQHLTKEATPKQEIVFSHNLTTFN